MRPVAEHSWLVGRKPFPEDCEFNLQHSSVRAEVSL